MKYQIRVTSHYLEEMDLTVVTEEVFRLEGGEWEAVSLSVCGSYLSTPEDADPEDDYVGHVEAGDPAAAPPEEVLATLRQKAHEAWKTGCRTSAIVPVTAEAEGE